MKKFAILTSILALAACGGGSGGGGAGAPIRSGDVIGSEWNVTVSNKDINKAILNIPASISDETARTKYLQDQFGSTEYIQNFTRTASSRRSSNVRKSPAQELNDDACKSVQQCNQLIFDNMKSIADQLDKLDTFDQIDVEYALIAAGFKSYIAKDWNKTKEWIMENKDTIKSTADKIFDTPGKGKPVQIGLNRAEFKTALTTLNRGIADKMTMEIDSSTGAVTGIKFTDVGSGSKSENKGLEKLYTGLTRNGTESTDFDFTSPDGTTKGTFEMASYAGALDLKYTDFGVLNGKDLEINGKEIPAYRIVFAGGYKDRLIAKQDIIRNNDLPKGDILFYGIADGTVEATNNNGGAANALLLKPKGFSHDDFEKIDGTGNAVLAINRENGSEQLEAFFENWYDITVTNTPEGHRIVKFADNTSGETSIKDAHKLNTLTVYQDGYFQPEYYGENNDPKEATVLFQYQQNVGADKNNDNINVFIGFGGNRIQ